MLYSFVRIIEIFFCLLQSLSSSNLTQIGYTDYRTFSRDQGFWGSDMYNLLSCPTCVPSTGAYVAFDLWMSELRGRFHGVLLFFPEVLLNCFCDGEIFDGE